MLQPNIFGYADDSTVVERYLSSPRAKPDEIRQAREAMVNRLNSTLQLVSEWGDANLVEFNASKTQACLFTAKRSALHLTPTFRGLNVELSGCLDLLGVSLSSNLNFGQYIESKAQLASKKLGIMSKVRRYSFSIYIKHKSVLVWSTAVIYGLVLPSVIWKLLT